MEMTRFDLTARRVARLDPHWFLLLVADGVRGKPALCRLARPTLDSGRGRPRGHWRHGGPPGSAGGGGAAVAVPCGVPDSSRPRNVWALAEADWGVVERPAPRRVARQPL